MRRRIFSDEHLAFRDTFSRFVAAEVAPHYPEWDEQRETPRAFYTKMAQNGYLCMWLPEELGGSGADFHYSVIIIEEIARAQCMGLLVAVHSDIVAPYIYKYGTGEQRRRWLPGCAAGEIILAVAMTEPESGSDLASIRTTAVRDGDDYVLNGQKTFISNGTISDLVVVAAKTDPDADPHRAGITLFAVERGTPGFIRGRKLDKMGMHIQDTAELAFVDCRVPAANRIGDEGGGFVYLMERLQQERLVLAVGALAWAESLMEISIEYAKNRRQFQRPISSFQVHRHKLAELATELEGCRAFMDRLIEEHVLGTDVVKETCMAKYWSTDLLKRMADYGVQLHGGYGYMREYAICRAYVDCRIQSIFGGTNEIMKEVISKRMGL